MVRLELYIFAALATLAVAIGNWSYKRPEEWVKDYPDCGGSQQSPIALNPKEATELTPDDLESHGIVYRLENFDTVLSASISNTGHALKINVKSPCIGTTPQLIAGNSYGETVYVLMNIYIHWESSHTINGKRYALELHLELRDSDNNGLVLTYLFDICEDTPKVMETVEKFLDKLVESGSSTEILLFSLADLLPKCEEAHGVGCRNLCNFVKYVGSITMPPCKRMLYIVILDILCVPKSQMELFHNIKDVNGDPMEGCRPLQPLNGREVKYVTC